jgi:HlyD family secretion protein
MKRTSIYLLVILLFLSLVGLPGCDLTSPSAPTPTVVAQVKKSEIAEAEGYVTPIKHAALSFEISGPVTEILVKEGDRVQAGQVLMRLDSADWRQRLSEAQAALEVAQAQLVRAQAQARPEELEVARAAIAIQEAQVGSAQAAISVAQTQLAQVEAPAKPEDVTAAKAVMKKAEVVLRKAQDDYDKISWATDVKLSQEAQALERASIDYEEAKARYEALLRGATAEERAIAKAQVEQARAQLPVVRAQIEQAKAQLALQEAGPRAEDIVLARVQVRQAEVALSSAQLNLEKVELTAPFAGTVAELPVEEGELVGVQQPVLTLADFSTWTVETDDLTEMDVVLVEVGQEASVTADALPGREFRGRVTKIAPRSQTKRGDQTYTVTVELGPDALEAGLRWGMTCLVRAPAE